MFDTNACRWAQDSNKNKRNVIIVNAEMADGRSIRVLSQFIEAPSSPEIIIISDSADPDEAELAIRSGAWDYVEKPRTANAMSLPVFTRQWNIERKNLKRKNGLACCKKPFM